MLDRDCAQMHEPRSGMTVRNPNADTQGLHSTIRSRPFSGIPTGVETIGREGDAHQEVKQRLTSVCANRVKLLLSRNTNWTSPLIT